MSLFLTNVKLSVINFVLPKTICEKANLSKTLEGRHFLPGGTTNIIFGRFLDI